MPKRQSGNKKGKQSNLAKLLCLPFLFVFCLLGIINF